ncbi:MAG: hypothetical protein M9894_24615 [Planctomycetes bacterium]|nr:hypothetical protein [Planctomycetota bacterium]
MSDTGKPAEAPRPAPSAAVARGGRCGKLVLGALVAGAVFCGYIGWALHASQADAPLPFEPVAYRPLEEALLTAKFEVLELGGRVLGRATDVELSPREVNLLLFGHAGHTATEKARVLLEGDLLEVEASRPRGAGSLNLTATLRPSLGPTTTTVEVLEARVGDYPADPLTRGLLRRWLEARLQEVRARDPRLGRVKALWVEKGKVRLVYE